MQPADGGPPSDQRQGSGSLEERGVQVSSAQRRRTSVRAPSRPRRHGPRRRLFELNFRRVSGYTFFAALVVFWFYVAYVVTQLGFAGGSYSLITTVAVGITGTFLVAILATMILKLRDPGWFVVWCALMVVFFGVALTRSWHDVRGGKLVKEIFTRPAGTTVPLPSEVSEGIYGCWTGFVRAVCEIQHAQCDLKAELRKDVIEAIRDNSPKGLVARRAVTDQYELAGGAGALARAKKQVGEFARRFDSFTQNSLEKLKPFERQLPALSEMRRSYLMWREHVLMISGRKLGDQLLGTIASEQGVLRALRDNFGSTSVDENGVIHCQNPSAFDLQWRGLENVDRQAEKVIQWAECH